jgi:thiosulfate/3-mercaptopyruvate sulfurtransferase
MGTSPLIGVAELASLLAGAENDSPPGRPVLLDVRYRMSGPTGRREFERAHIPGASYVDMDTELATIRTDGVGGRHPVPAVATFTAAMRSAGVTMSRPVVAYDDWASLPASRLWWILRHLSFPDVRVLDGGMAAWTAAGQPAESGPDTAGAGDFSPSSGGVGRLLDADEAAAYAGRRLLLDARPADRFRGENESIDPVAGHIPGAVSAPALANVDSRGRFLPVEELAGRFRHLITTGEGGADDPGADDPDADDPDADDPKADDPKADDPKADDPGTTDICPAATGAVGTYCGSGVQATHLALALNVAGICDDADVYIGSWSDWITDPTRPVEV